MSLNNEGIVEKNILVKLDPLTYGGLHFDLISKMTELVSE